MCLELDIGVLILLNITNNYPEITSDKSFPSITENIE